MTGLVAFGNNCVSLAQCSSRNHLKMNYPLNVFPLISDYFINIKTYNFPRWLPRNDENAGNTVVFLHKKTQTNLFPRNVDNLTSGKLSIKFT